MCCREKLQSSSDERILDLHVHGRAECLGTALRSESSTSTPALPIRHE